MPSRSNPRGGRQDAPAPFSAEWTVAPPPPPRPRRLAADGPWKPPSLPPWFPSERTLSTLLVLLLVIGTALIGNSVGPSQVPAPGGDSDELEIAAADATWPPVVVATEPANESEGAAVAAQSTVESTGPTEARVPVVNLTPPSRGAGGQHDGAVFPEYRILSYYGHPWSDKMGILGEYEIEELHDLLLEEVAAYELVDPSRPVIPAFEVIASVAQPEPQADGTYLLHTDATTIDRYSEFAAANDMLLILDVQIGYSTVTDEIESVMPWLRQPHVHLAIDPEFAMKEGQTPGIHIGSVDATDIVYAQQTLANLSAELGIPPKVLIVHQFHHGMISNKDLLEPMPGVQLVIDADGWGDPDLKTATYNAVIRDEEIEYNGFKLFYRQDVPLMTPEQVLGLNPMPDLIIYQ